MEEQEFPNDLKINAYGTVDELNAYVGLLRDLIDDSNYISQLIEIQDRLFTAGSLLAVSDEGTKMKIPTIKSRDISSLESWIDSMDNELPEMKFFVLPEVTLLSQIVTHKNDLPKG